MDFSHDASATLHLVGLGEIKLMLDTSCSEPYLRFGVKRTRLAHGMSLVTEDVFSAKQADFVAFVRGLAEMVGLRVDIDWHQEARRGWPAETCEISVRKGQIVLACGGQESFFDVEELAGLIDGLITAREQAQRWWSSSGSDNAVPDYFTVGKDKVQDDNG